MELTAFDFRIEDNIAYVTLKQGARGNPFDMTFCEEFNRIAIECDDSNKEVRAVLIDAEGPFFSVGGDLKTLATGERKALARFVKDATSHMHMGVSRFARMDAPLIVQTDALMAGGAVAIAAACDFLLAGPNAKFYGAFTGIGFSCDCGSSYFLPRRVGTRKALSFFVKNETWTAEQALEYGLVSEIHPSEELAGQALALAKKIANGPTFTFGKMKTLMLESYSNTLETHMELESRSLAECARTEDTWEAVLAVANKKKPQFNYK